LPDGSSSIPDHTRRAPGGTLATALARNATFPAPSAQAAEDLFERAVLPGPRVKQGISVSHGPGKVGGVA
jgi:hypothetical protein